MNEMEARARRERAALGYVVAVATVSALVAVKLTIATAFPDAALRTPYILIVGAVAYYFGRGPGTTAFILSTLGYTGVSTPVFLPELTTPFDVANQIEYIIFLFVNLAALMAMVSLRDSQRRMVERSEELVAEVRERRQAEESLRQSEVQLKTIVESLAEGLIVSDLEGNLTHWNGSALRMHGFASLEEGLRQLPEFRDIFELSTMDGKVLEMDEWPVPRILRGEQLRDWDVRIRRIDSDWERVFSYGGTLVRAAEDQPLLAVVTITDITERKRSEEDIRRLNEELEQRVAARTAELEAANKELEAFSYSVSHDMRAPLRAIDGFSNTLLKYYQDSLDERGRDYLQRVRNASQRMAQLIDDILGLSRAARAEMRRQRVDMSALARDILDDLLRGQPERRAEIRIAENMKVDADPHLLRIALVNLLSNAWKFTSQGPISAIEVGVIEQPRERVYYVKDNGVGFDPVYADKLFSPFQRLHAESEFPGTGIGLALVQRILRRHGGSIWAKGEVGQGATFYFTIGDTGT